MPPPSPPAGLPAVYIALAAGGAVAAAAAATLLCVCRRRRRRSSSSSLRVPLAAGASSSVQQGGRRRSADSIVHVVAPAVPAADGSVAVDVPPSLLPGQSFKIAMTDAHGQPRTFRVRVPEEHAAGAPLRIPLGLSMLRGMRLPALPE